MPIQRVCHLMIGQSTETPLGTFVFTVQTTGGDETFALPLESDGTYDFAVDWGDTNSDNISAWDDATKTHTYASAGTYEISITGTLYGFRFGLGGDKAKIYELKAWGAVRLGNNAMYFAGCSNLTITATDILDLTGTTDLSYAFYSCTSLTLAPSMNSWDVSNVINMYALFRSAPLFNQNIGNWNVSSVTNMGDMFRSASVFNQNIGSWNVSSVLDMSKMFNLASAFNQNIGGWNVSNVLDMGYMFYGASLFNQNIENWNVSSVTNMYAMFQDASVFNRNIGNWIITSVISMGSMFVGITLSTANWSAILIGFEAQNVLDNVPLHGGNSKYSAGAASTARQALIDDHTWGISDGGQA